MNNTTTPILQCHDLYKHFQDSTQTLPILNKLTLTVHKGEKIAIVGASGSGKSTLLQILGGLQKPSSGTVQILGQSLHQLTEKQLNVLHNQSIGFVYQFHHLLPEFNLLENTCMPLLIQGIQYKIAKQRSWSLLKKMGLEHRAHYKPSEISGGERQRVAIARCSY